MQAGKVWLAHCEVVWWLHNGCQLVPTVILDGVTAETAYGGLNYSLVMHLSWLPFACCAISRMPESIGVGQIPLVDYL